jgi:predicted small secreted protein
MRFMATMLLLAFAFALGGCNTMEGLGKDLSILGDKIRGKANENR